MIQAFDPAHRGLQPTGREQIGLLEEIESYVPVPTLVAEAAITPLRFDDGLAFGTEFSANCSLPKVGISLGDLQLRLQKYLGLLHGFKSPVHEGFGYERRIGDCEVVDIGLVIQNWAKTLRQRWFSSAHFCISS